MDKGGAKAERGYLGPTWGPLINKFLSSSFTLVCE